MLKIKRLHAFVMRLILTVELKFQHYGSGNKRNYQGKGVRA